MINKSNDLPSFVNETNLPKIVDNLTDASNIKIANIIYGNRVQTVIDKIVEKADDVTKAIKQEIVNNSYSFKVGTGDVDVSTDVEDGFGEIGLKGVTYQNLLGTLVTVGKEWVESDNKYTLNLPSGSGQPQIRYNLAYPLKPNAKYTLICEIKEYTTGYPHFCFMTKDNTTLASTTEFTSNSVGIKTAILTTKSDVNAELLRILPRNNIDNIYSIGKNIILLEGDHTNNPNLPSYFEGIVGVGDKSKNLFNGKLEEGQLDTTTGLPIASKDRCRSVDYIEVEKNTEYRIQINNTQSKAPWTTVFLYDSNKNYINFAQDSNGGSNLTFNTGEAKYIKFKLNVKASSVTKAQVSKGSSDISYEPYYEGNKIEILSNGKNLFKPDIVTDTKSYTLHTSNGYWGTVFKVKPNTDYKITSKSDGFNLTTIAQSYVYFIGNGGGECWIVHQTSNPSGDSEGIVNSGSKGEIYIRMPNYTFPIIPYMLIHRKIQIEEGTTGTTYTPYIEDKTQILLDEPLMRLPNGVCDEITRDGKLIRRVGKVVLDGSEKWKVDLCLDKENKYFSAILDAKLMVNSYYENVKMASLLVDNPYTVTDKICISVYPQDGIVARVQHPSLDKTTPNSIKEWLSQNPVTIYYQLETPIITDIVPPTLRIFKDGHITFDTLVAPESSHLVQLNKSGQIQNAIKESQSLDNRINVLENNYDNLILFTMSRLNDLELNYTLK